MRALNNFFWNKLQLLNKKPYVGLDRVQANELIYEKILSDKPLLVSRLGSSECMVALSYKYKYTTSLLTQLKLRSLGAQTKWSEKLQDDFLNKSGFITHNKSDLETFSKLYISCFSAIDILGSWQNGESFFHELDESVKVKLNHLEPYLSDRPWTRALANKKVLVIHPFSYSILKQYESYKDHLFKDKNVLPNFNLQVYRSKQTLALESINNQNWFKNLEAMKRDISKIDFEVALVAAGAYGLPLSFYMKQLGKKVIHIGGPLQLLFGIKGKRWESIPSMRKLFNNYWIHPCKEDRIKNLHFAENGAYW